MKYCILILDGASGWPLPDHGGKTCLDLAHKPNLDTMAREGAAGMANSIPEGMEPSSAIGCMSVLGYDPKVYYGGRSGIEARAIGVTWGKNQVVFRCNLVAIKDGRMQSYSAGHITSDESKELIAALQQSLGSPDASFHRGVAYRHILKTSRHPELATVSCTPPHDIPNQPIAGHLPKGPGSEFLIDLMERSKAVLADHPINVARRSAGKVPATQIWLFWPTGEMPHMPSFQSFQNIEAVMTSAVDLLRGLAAQSGIKFLTVPGATDGPDNDYAGQAKAALEALERKEMAIIHVESPDEAGHAGSVEEKVKAIEAIDREIAARLRTWRPGELRVLAMPDHPTPIKVQTHVSEPVPFFIWGPGIRANGATAYTEAQAKATGLAVDRAHALVGRLTGRTTPQA